MKRIRIGGGAGYSGDRIEPAVDLAARADIEYLIFECLAERTIALAQQTRLRDAAQGYDPLLAERMRAVLDLIRQRGDPPAVPDPSVAALGDRIVSANAYIGAEPIARALGEGADVVITGRVADPSLVVGPLVHEFGWKFDDWSRLGQATLAGHLLECAGQVTGGYFADPGVKDMPDLAHLGFPVGEIAENGSLVITKLSGSGGRVTPATCKEQILYEVHDPSAYVTPDVVADFSRVTVKEIASDRVAIDGAAGRPRTDTLKVSIGYLDSYVGEGQISYAGPGAVARGRLAIEIVEQRLKAIGVRMSEVRAELIGIDALHGPTLSGRSAEAYEVRVRVAGRTDSLEEATRIGNEVETLYTCGPAAGGGVTKTAKEIIAVASMLLPRHLVTPVVHFVGG